MAIDIGPRIGMDGEPEFRKQLNQINTALKTLGTEMQKVSSEFSENANSQQALIAKNKVLNKQIETEKQKLGEVQKALTAAEQAYGENSTQALKWQQVLNRTETNLNKLESELKQNDRALDEMKRGLRDAETGLETFDDAAKKADDSVGGFGQSLMAGLSAGAIIGAIQGIASSISNLVSETQEYRRIMASLEISSQNAGYSAEQTANTYRTLYGVLGDDQTAATTTANLQALGLSQEQLTSLTNGAIGAWATYGDSIPIDSLSEAINETVRVGTVTGTFADMLNWAGTSEDEFNAKLAACGSETERANLVLQEMANQGLIQAGEGWQSMNSDIVAGNQATADLQATMSEFAQLVSPLVTGVKEAFNDVLQIVLQLIGAFQSGGIEGFVSTLSQIFSNIGGVISQNAGGFLEAGASIITGIAEGIRMYFPQLLDMLAQIFAQIGENIPTFLDGLLTSLQSIGDMLSELAPVLVQKGFEMLQSLVSGIVEGLPTLIERVPQIVSTFANIINDNFPVILMKGGELLLQLAMGIIQAIPTLIANIPQIITAIVDVLMAFQWVNLGRNIIKFLGDGIGAMKDFVVQKGVDILNGLKNVILNLPSTLANIGRSAMSGLGNAISSAWGAIRSAASNIVDAVVGAVTSIPGQMLSIGKNIVQGLWNGISDMTGWIIDKIQGFGASVLDGIKSFFGIASPSKLMEDQVGKFMAEGIAVGFQREMASVNRQIQKSLRSTMEGNEKIIATAQTSFNAQIDYKKLADAVSFGGLYFDGRLVGRAFKKGGITLA